MTKNEKRLFCIAREELLHIYDDRENNWEQLLSNVEKALGCLNLIFEENANKTPKNKCAKGGYFSRGRDMSIVTNDEFTKNFTLTKEDVWGDYTKGTKGMIVASSNDICPVFNDKVPCKSVTIICDETQLFEVEYWLDYVQGGNSVQQSMQMPDSKVALRSDYQCW